MWQVTKDHIEDKGAAIDVDVQSPDYDDAKADTLTEQFRMYDDDGNLYYEGVSDDSNSERAFDPLDDYGTPNAGCTYIKYLDAATGKWEIL